MEAARSSTILLAWAAVLAAALLLAFGPRELNEHLQSLLADASAPALLGFSQLFPARASQEPDTLQPLHQDALLQSLQASQYRVAQLEEQLAEARSRLDDPLPQETPLLSTERVPSLILGTAGSLSLVGRRLIGLGAQHGLLGEELVLDGTGLLIDQGQDTGIEPDQLVTDGRAIVGRITRVGQWTSLVAPVTDPGFRAAARLVRQGAEGPVFGARGILAGSGDQCELQQVPASEAVSAGDAVYCDDPGLDGPLILGRVETAVLQPTAPFWTIRVLPVRTIAAASGNAGRVIVLKTQFNPARLSQH